MRPEVTGMSTTSVQQASVEVVGPEGRPSTVLKRDSLGLPAVAHEEA